MFEVKGDLWKLPADVICITTNGFVKKDGKAVMGRGCAKEAADRYRELPTLLGDKITRLGNNVHYLTNRAKDGKVQSILSFPVKHNWFEEADINLIKRSCDQLMNWKFQYNENYQYEHREDRSLFRPVRFIALPRPGCGNGKLEWQEVKEVIKDRLDDSVGVVCYGD